MISTFFSEKQTTEIMPVTAEYLVVDSGGFIKNDVNSLHNMTDNIFTLHDVVSELRDKEVRQRLRNTPVEMTYATPSSDGIKKVSEFARKTGDYASLSVVDIRFVEIYYLLEIHL